MTFYLDPASVAVGFGLGIVATIIAIGVIAYVAAQRKAK